MTALKAMINHHGNGVFDRALQTLWTWHLRSVQRSELARWSEYDLHDIGLSRSEVAGEIDKPFWRA
jgi:uncharacterized protein YjiS (DUF1127 family)